jgi:hypothetical protein
MRKGGETGMRKLIILGIGVGFLLSVLMVTGVFAKDEVVYDNSYGQIKFNHKKHAETLKIDCIKCHHTWKKGDTSGQLCKDCHKDKAEGKNLAYKDAYHKDCKGCHDEAKKANKPAGPVTCTQCHNTKEKKK